MASPRLSNYLRTHRKRLGLSQAELAHLLGAEGGAKVCRYEKFVRVPTLETALACEVVFKKPVSELFAGLYQNIERRLAIRAKRLAQRNDSGKPGPHTVRKRQLLAAMAAPLDKKSPNK
jgi:transcriptional regulator with XRE-family HTH domain